MLFDIQDDGIFPIPDAAIMAFLTCKERRSPASAIREKWPEQAKNCFGKCGGVHGGALAGFGIR